MFYPCDYEVKLLKEQEIRERVSRAEIDRFARSIRPARASLIRRLLHWLATAIAHSDFGLGKPSDAARSEFRAKRRSNAVQ
jgi:hypothetical protein